MKKEIETKTFSRYNWKKDDETKELIPFKLISYTFTLETETQLPASFPENTIIDALEIY